MSIALQKQIRDNATDVSSYRSDLARWTDDQNKEESRRGLRKRGGTLPTASTASQNKDLRPNDQVCAEVALKSVAEDAGVNAASKKVSDVASAPEDLKRDKTAMHQYYRSWDNFDADAEAERIDDEILDGIRSKQAEKQAEKDRILDELAINGEGDRTRTSKARPRVKVAVRMNGRRPSPVDLAEPRKKEANGYFASGRFREAVAAYTAALELLEKYEPPGLGSEADNADDSAGVETEALQLKTTLLANRAAALLKLEEWRLVVEDCTEALRFEPEHGKSILRRGFAYARLKRWLPAAKDLERALVWDPEDKKATAELLMAKRMLEEQAKEARNSAKMVVSDPGRAPTCPTRRLTVRVKNQRPKGAADSISAVGGSGAVTAAPESKPEATSVVNRPEAVTKYVPRAVRMRGNRVATGASGTRATAPASPSGAQQAQRAPAMNFYSFETLWCRQSAQPTERLALLRRAGPESLPSLFRESLDSELVASIVDVLAGSISVDEKTCSKVDQRFALDVLANLTKTSRFDSSCQALLPQEREACVALLTQLEKAADDASKEEIGKVRACYAFISNPVSGKDDDDVSDEDRAREAWQSKHLPETDIAPGPAQPSKQSTLAFSLDACD